MAGPLHHRRDEGAGGTGVNWDDFSDAVNNARRTVGQGDAAARQLAWLLVGRLRVAEVSQDALRSLKKELADFNAVTGKWKGQE